MKVSTFILVLLMLILLCIDNDTEYFNSFVNAQPTKCFDCEKGIPKEKKYISGPTKCFSCEKDIHQRFGGQYSEYGQPTKCFDCERQVMRAPW